MSEDKKRYDGPGTTRYSYQDSYLVACPKCDQAATVTPATRRYRFANEGRIHCDNCHYHQDASDKIRYSVIVRRNCDNCGNPVRVNIPNVKVPVESLLTTCSSCGITREEQPNNKIVLDWRRVYGVGNDPIFGYPLWLQGTLRGRFFFAYNRTHLRHIAAYVGSSLRERQVAGYTTMVERLPKFITSGKNRDDILKLIAKLERK